MAFGTVIFTFDFTALDIQSAGGTAHDGRQITFTGNSTTLIYSVYRHAVNKAYTTGTLFIYPHRQRHHRNGYMLNVLSSSNQPQRPFGTAATVVRTGGGNFVVGHMHGRRAWLGTSAPGAYYEHINRATIRGAPSAGLTTPLAFCNTDRYTYVIHNTNKLVKVDRRNQAIVAEATLPVNGNAADGLCTDDRNLIYLAASADDKIYWLRAA